MTKKQLKDYIELYKLTENSIEKLDKEFGICIWNSESSNFYNYYNYLLHKLLEYIYGSDGVTLLEDYIWEQIDISFDDLCKRLNIKDETNTK